MDTPIALRCHPSVRSVPRSWSLVTKHHPSPSHSHIQPVCQPASNYNPLVTTHSYTTSSTMLHRPPFALPLDLHLSDPSENSTVSISSPTTAPLSPAEPVILCAAPARRVRFGCALASESQTTLVDAVAAAPARYPKSPAPHTFKSMAEVSPSRMHVALPWITDILSVLDSQAQVEGAPPVPQVCAPPARKSSPARTSSKGPSLASGSVLRRSGGSSSANANVNSTQLGAPTQLNLSWAALPSPLPTRSGPGSGSGFPPMSGPMSLGLTPLHAHANANANAASSSSSMDKFFNLSSPGLARSNASPSLWEECRSPREAIGLASLSAAGTGLAQRLRSAGWA